MKTWPRMCRYPSAAYRRQPHTRATAGAGPAGAGMADRAGRDGGLPPGRGDRAEYRRISCRHAGAGLLLCARERRPGRGAYPSAAGRAFFKETPKKHSPPPGRGGGLLAALEVVVHGEFSWAGDLQHLVAFLAFALAPDLDQAFRENAARGQIVMVCFQRVQCFV